MLKDLIKNLRLKAELTQTELSKELKLPQSCISFWEKGKREPNIDGLKKLAEYFNVSTDFLLGLEPLTVKAANAPTLQEDEQSLLDAYHNLTPGQKKGLFQMLEIDQPKSNKNKA